MTANRNNLRVIGISGEKRRGEVILVEEIIVKNFTNLKAKMGVEIQKPQRAPTRVNLKTTPRHFVIDGKNQKYI